MNTLSDEWIQITDQSDIPMREGRSVKLGSLNIALFNLGDRFLAIENRCPHNNGPLADGIVGGHGLSTTVTCPLHNWRICLDTGKVVKPTNEHAPCVRTFPVKVENGVVMLSTLVEVPEECAA